MINFIKNHKKQISNILSICLILFFISVISSSFITKQITGKSTVFGYKPFYIMSESMDPVIKVGHIVISKPINANDIDIGDIIAYKTPSKTVIHRVIKINDDETYEFKGDNNKTQIPSDIHVTANQIQYKIVKIL